MKNHGFILLLILVLNIFILSIVTLVKKIHKCNRNMYLSFVYWINYIILTYLLQNIKCLKIFFVANK